MNTNLKAILWAAFVMLTWSRSGGAQAVAKTCIPRAIGVPGLWQQPPNWWSNGRPRLPRFDDPRWQGATSHTDGSGDAQHVDFRALQRSDTLFLSWVVKVDPELNPHVGIIDTQAEDELWFGIEQQGGESPVVLKFVFKTTGAGEALTHSDADGYNVMVWLADMVADPTLMTLGAWQYSSNSTDPNKLPPPWITGTGAAWQRSPPTQTSARRTRRIPRFCSRFPGPHPTTYSLYDRRTLPPLRGPSPKTASTLGSGSLTGDLSPAGRPVPDSGSNSLQ